MAHFLNKEFVEESWLLPQLQSLLAARKENCYGFHFFESVEVEVVPLVRGKDEKHFYRRLHDYPQKMVIGYIRDSEDHGLIIKVLMDNSVARVIRVFNILFRADVDFGSGWESLLRPFMLFNWRAETGIMGGIEPKIPENVEEAVKRDAKQFDRVMWKAIERRVKSITAVSKLKNKSLLDIVDAVVVGEKSKKRRSKH